MGSGGGYASACKVGRQCGQYCAAPLSRHPLGHTGKMKILHKGSLALISMAIVIGSLTTASSFSAPDPWWIEGDPRAPERSGLDTAAPWSNHHTIQAVEAIGRFPEEFSSAASSLSWTPLSAFPAGFASCAGSAMTVKEAAYNCLKNWRPAMSRYPGKVIFHFSPSLTQGEKDKIKEMTYFTLLRTKGFINFMGDAPDFHLFFNIDGKKQCKKMVKSWRGTRTLSWIWERGVCSRDYYGGQSTGSSIKGTSSAVINVLPASSFYGAEWWTYYGMPHEIMVDFFGPSVEKKLGSKTVGLEVGQRWVHYLASRAAWQAASIQGLDLELESCATPTRYCGYHNNLVVGGGAATWRPSVSDPRFCPDGNSKRARRCGKFDWVSLSTERPYQYQVMDLASQFVTATFGPEWVQRTLWPAMVREYARANLKYPMYKARGNFRLEMDRVAKALWGGLWSDFETAIDAYVVSALESKGMTFPSE